MKSEAIISLDWGRVRFFLGEVGRNFTRNAGMQATAIGTVALTIVLLGLFLQARASMMRAGSIFMNEITISAFMKPNVTPAQENRVRRALAADPRISTWQFVPKAEGLREMRRLLKGQIDMSILDENPLPDKFGIRVHDASQVPAVARMVRKLPGVNNVEYGGDIVRRLVQLEAVARPVGIAIIAVLFLIAAIIISNTIRLTVFARRREIAIMQLVGATNTYIRMPFIFEGMLAGLIGALCAIGVLAAAQASFVPKVLAALPWLNANVIPMDPWAFVPQLVGVGCAVGILASWFAVGRYLRT